MKYQIVDYDWPAAHHSAPILVGTIIDTDQAEWTWLKDRPPPINAKALDRQTYYVLRQRYPYWHTQSAPEIQPAGSQLRGKTDVLGMIYRDGRGPAERI